MTRKSPPRERKKKSGAAQSDFTRERNRWRRNYAASVTADDARRNRSGIPLKPLYTPEDWNSGAYVQDLGFPGALPATRGIYPSMHRGRPWSQRQLIGLATPGIYNKRMRELLAAGVDALSMIPCNSVYRGFDIDEVPINSMSTSSISNPR